MLFETAGIAITNWCNAQCDMCCFECSPKGNCSLSLDTICNIVDQLADIGIKNIGFSGGECMKNKSIVLSAAKYAGTKAVSCSVTTNGFWAKKHSDCVTILNELFEVGIRKLSVSIDDCHLKYVDLQCLKNIISVNKKVGLSLRIGVGDSLSGKRAAEIISELGSDAYGQSLLIYPFIPVGRGADIPIEQLATVPYEKEWKCCYDKHLSILYDGSVHPCCSQAIYKSKLSKGNIYDKPLSDIISEYENDGLFSTLLRQGLDFFVEIAKDCNEIELPKQYVSNCHLCNFLFSNSNFAKIAERYAQQEYVNHAKKMFLNSISA